jgi:hypothetical protein
MGLGFWLVKFPQPGRRKLIGQNRWSTAPGHAHACLCPHAHTPSLFPAMPPTLVCPTPGRVTPTLEAKLHRLCRAGLTASGMSSTAALPPHPTTATFLPRWSTIPDSGSEWCQPLSSTTLARSCTPADPVPPLHLGHRPRYLIGASRCYHILTFLFQNVKHFPTID